MPNRGGTGWCVADGGSAARRTFPRLPVGVSSVAVAALLLIGGSATVVHGSAARSPARTGSGIAVFSNPDRATVTWRVRSAGPVRLRLYRALAGGAETVVEEVVTRSGIESFQVVDRSRPSGSVLYQIRAAGLDGAEVVLGTVVCVEPRFSSPGTPATPDRSGNAVAALVETPDHDTWFAPPAEIADARAGMMIPLGPDPPVPRPTAA